MSIPHSLSIHGTQHHPLPGARAIAPTDPNQRIEISLVLRHRQPLPYVATLERHLSHAEFASQYGADPAHVERLRQFAREYGLEVLERDDAIQRRTVTLAGTAAAMEKAFSVQLRRFDHPDGTYRGRIGTIHMPKEYAPLVSGVFGLDDRPVVRPHLRFRAMNSVLSPHAVQLSYTAQQVAAAYSFPSDGTGAGQTIGILEFGGGFRTNDIRDYFASLGLNPPSVTAVLVDNAINNPSTAQSADGEVMLDIEVAGTVAPGASIVVYFAPNTERGFQDALSTAVHDQVHRPSIISISWGGPEAGWAAQSMTNFDQVAQEAALLGITIPVATGDSGSSDGIDDGKTHVDFPASSPHVLATGGTRLVVTNGAIQSETVWNDGAQGGATGGGFSTEFAQPSWQSKLVSNAGRGIPDVAGNADPQTGYEVLIDGQKFIIGGTSAVAPLWAGLVALLNQKLNRRLGFLNPALYSLGQTKAFRDIVTGNNGAYSATAGWDPCTGQGSPDGTVLLSAMEAPAASHASTHASTHQGSTAPQLAPRKARST